MISFSRDLLTKNMRKRKGNTMIDCLLSLQETQHDYYTDIVIKGFVVVTRKWLLINRFNQPPPPPMWELRIACIMHGHGLMGYHVPCGIMMLVNIWATQRDQRLISFRIWWLACHGSGLCQRLANLNLGSLVQFWNRRESWKWKCWH